MKKKEINFLSTDIKNLVLKKLESGESLFMLRMGDGEMRIEKNHSSIEKFSIKEFGRKLTEDELETSKKWMKESVLESSILGLPTLEHCKTNELWEYLFNYYQEIEEKNPDIWKKKEYCSINSHYELLGTGDLFEILSKVKKIVVVSPRDIQSKLTERFVNLEIIEYYSLPGEQAYEPVENKNKNINIFERITEIIQELKSKERKGELLIFGAGPLGKILGCEFSKQGGVALDLGSVFDLFVGKITRGEGKGPNSKIKPIL
jgi:hypothetical protein